MSKIEIEIGGDASELRKELISAKKELKDLERSKEAKIKLGADTSDIEKKISDVKKQMSGLDSQLTKTTQATQGFSKATANGGNTLTQFSRIAQDAPFGIIGIGNNLTATAEAFGNLSRSSGGAGNALKAVGASLLGSGGVIFAISLLTTGLTYLAQSGLTISDVFNKLTGNFNAVANELKKASEEGTKSAQEEIAVLKALVFTAQNENLSRRERLVAVEKLKSLYPGYLNDLSIEEIMYGNLSNVINDVSKALIDKAIAEKIATKAGDAQYRILELNAQILKQKEAITQAEENFYKAAKEGSAATESASLAIDRQKSRLQEIRAEYLQTKKALEAYQNVLNNKTSSSILTQVKPPPKAKKSKADKRPNISSIVDFEAFDPAKYEAFAKKELALFQGTFGNAVEIFKNTKIPLEIPLQPYVHSGLLTEMQKILKEFNSDASALIQNSLVEGIGNLGTAIGEALANGGNVLSAVGNSILQSLGKFLSEMGGLLIQYGTLAVIKGKLDLAIAAGGPISIGAGLAAIAVGVALKAIGGAIGSKAKQGSGGGGASGASTNTGGNSFSTSSTTGSSGGFSGGTVVFEISGQKLIGVLSNTLDANKRLGGALGI